MTADGAGVSERAADRAFRAEISRPARFQWHLLSLLWLAQLAYPVVTMVERQSARPWVLALCAACYVAIGAGYVVLPPMTFRLPEGDPRRFAAPLLLFVLGTAMVPLSGPAGLVDYVFVAATAIVLLPTAPAVAVLCACAAVDVGTALWVPGWQTAALSNLYGFGAASLAIAMFNKLIRTLRELVATRAQLAELTITEERNRLARDLHDILGHSLTVITVKAGLAVRLADRDAGRAREEMAEVERLGRAALADVRSTVSGFRKPSLAAELATAKGVLAAAGITAHLPHAVDEVPGERQELFGWIVREGVTNVVRHSNARACRIRVWPEGVEIVDDGRHGQPPGTERGTGLTGLSERVTEAGGCLEAGPDPGGGFRLRAVAPLPGGCAGAVPEVPA